MNVHWKDWCWSWNSNTLATWFKELNSCFLVYVLPKRAPKNWLLGKDWCWKRLKAGEERDDRRWDGWMASPTWWTWVWASFGSWWWEGKPGVLQFMASQSWAWLSDWTELSHILNWKSIIKMITTSRLIHVWCNHSTSGFL